MKKNSDYTYLDGVKESIKDLSRYGLKGFYCSQKTLEIIKSWKQPVSFKPEITRQKASFEENNSASLNIDNQQKLVVGRGEKRARILFVAPWPDYEDPNHLPHLGEEGKLFSKILSAMKLSSRDLYMCHIIRENPMDDTLLSPQNCRDVTSFINLHIQKYHPEVICTLGKMASQMLLSSNNPLKSLRGQFHTYGGVKLMPTYHPFDLITHPHKKRDVWDDMKMIMNTLKITI